MIYSASITTPANTAEADKQRTVIKATKGLLWRIEVEFPPGCAGLCHIQIMDGKYQVFPASPGESIHSDAALVGFDDLYYKTAGPFEFHVMTWNLDDTWDHTLQVRLGLASSDAFMARYLPSMAWENFQLMLDKAASEQAVIQAEQLKEFATLLGKPDNEPGT